MFTFCFESIKKRSSRQPFASVTLQEQKRCDHLQTLRRGPDDVISCDAPPGGYKLRFTACMLKHETADRLKTGFKIDASDDRCARLSFNHNSPPLPERAPGIKRGGLRRLLVRTRCHENYRFEKFKTMCYFSNLTWVRKGKGYATIKATVQPLC